MQDIGGIRGVAAAASRGDGPIIADVTDEWVPGASSSGSPQNQMGQKNKQQYGNNGYNVSYSSPTAPQPSTPSPNGPAIGVASPRRQQNGNVAAPVTPNQQQSLTFTVWLLAEPLIRCEGLPLACVDGAENISLLLVSAHKDYAPYIRYIVLVSDYNVTPTREAILTDFLNGIDLSIDNCRDLLGNHWDFNLFDNVDTGEEQEQVQPEKPELENNTNNYAMPFNGGQQQLRYPGPRLALEGGPLTTTSDT
ncbi:unnamed protein product, partial [Strongylus vulgaris]